MADDVLDLVASEESFIGKPAGSDIGEGTYTLPVLYASRRPSGERDPSTCLRTERRPIRVTIDRIIELTVDGGYVDRVVSEAAERLRLAEKASSRLPDNELRPILRGLESYLTDRVIAARG